MPSAYLNPNLRYPALSKYHLESGFIHFCSHGRFMINGARDGTDMMVGDEVVNWSGLVFAVVVNVVFNVPGSRIETKQESTTVIGLSSDPTDRRKLQGFPPTTTFV
jgi:hypothetical protein